MATTGTTPETLVSAQEQLAARAAESQFSRFFKRWWLAYAMMIPLFAFYFVFVIVPVIASLFLSFTYYNILEAPAWIGWNNYRLLFLEDDVFPHCDRQHAEVCPRDWPSRFLPLLPLCLGHQADEGADQSSLWPSIPPPSPRPWR